MADFGGLRLDWDVAVVGAGPAGIAAASSAAEAGASVLVLDHGLRPGGQIWRHRDTARLPSRARAWLDRLERSGARVVCRASVLDAPAGGLLLVEDAGGGAVELAAGAIVLATGARERFIPFPGWTLPGVVGVGGAQALLKGGAKMTGRRTVVAGSGPLLLPVAAALAGSGARLSLVAEQAGVRSLAGFVAGLWRQPDKLAQALSYRARFPATRYASGTWVTEALGDDRVRAVVLTDGRRSWSVPCDLLCTGYGLVPGSELAQSIGCESDGGFVRCDAWQRTSVDAVYCAGEPAGIGGVDAALVEGEIAGLAAAGRAQEAARLFPLRDRCRAFTRRLANAFSLRGELRALPSAETIVCRCEDVRFGAIRPEWSGRQAKLYTRAAMGPCQGRICGAALEFLFNWTPVVVRAPVESATVSSLTNPVARSGETSERGHGKK